MCVWLSHHAQNSQFHWSEKTQNDLSCWNLSRCSQSESFVQPSRLELFNENFKANHCKRRKVKFTKSISRSFTSKTILRKRGLSVLSASATLSNCLWESCFPLSFKMFWKIRTRQNSQVPDLCLPTFTHACMSMSIVAVKPTGHLALYRDSYLKAFLFEHQRRFPSWTVNLFCATNLHWKVWVNFQIVFSSFMQKFGGCHSILFPWSCQNRYLPLTTQISFLSCRSRASTLISLAFRVSFSSVMWAVSMFSVETMILWWAISNWSLFGNHLNSWKVEKQISFPFWYRTKSGVIIE